jgi:hypothetical protein
MEDGRQRQLTRHQLLQPQSRVEDLVARRIRLIIPGVENALNFHHP